MGGGSVTPIEHRRQAESPSLEARDSTPRTPLAIAFATGRLGIFRLLLHRGADPNLVFKGPASFIDVTDNTQNTMLQELVENGVDPRVAELMTLESATQALVVAARDGNIKRVSLLIEKGANIHVQDGVPGKALHLAARSLHIDVVTLLLNRGVDVNAFGGIYG